LLSRVGEPFLAWAAADRAMFAAEQSGDPLLAAASAWRLSYMITGRKHPQEALGLAMAAAAALDRTMRAPSPERLSVYGALHLAAATAAAASFDPATTGSLLATARGVADRPSTPSRRRSGSATPGPPPRSVRHSTSPPCPSAWWAGEPR
jgi:hypothetical protein